MAQGLRADRPAILTRRRRDEEGDGLRASTKAVRCQRAKRVASRETQSIADKLQSLPDVSQVSIVTRAEDRIAPE